MLGEVVQLAAANCVPVVTPGEDFGVQALVESVGEPGLGFFQEIQRNSHAYGGDAVLENIVYQAVERAHELDVHRGRRIAGIRRPLVAPLVPGDARMSVLHVNHEAHQAIPKEEGHQESEYQQRADRFAAVNAPEHQAADPYYAEGQD